MDILKYWTLLKYGKYVEYFKLYAEIYCFSLSFFRCFCLFLSGVDGNAIGNRNQYIWRRRKNNQITTDSVDISRVKTNVIEFCMIINIEPFVLFIFYRFIILIIKNNITVNHTITTTKYMYNWESDEFISNSVFCDFLFIGSSTLELSIWA